MRPEEELSGADAGLKDTGDGEAAKILQPRDKSVDAVAGYEDGVVVLKFDLSLERFSIDGLIAGFDAGIIIDTGWR